MDRRCASVQLALSSHLLRPMATMGSVSPLPRTELEEMDPGAQRLRGKVLTAVIAHFVQPRCIQTGDSGEKALRGQE